MGSFKIVNIGSSNVLTWKYITNKFNDNLGVKDFLQDKICQRK